MTEQFPLFQICYLLCGVYAALRSSEAQGLLAELSALPNISLVASMDHVNTPLLWDKQMAARFDWLYFDVTNYTPYYLETANVPSLLVGRRQVNSSSAWVRLTCSNNCWVIPQLRTIDAEHPLLCV